MKMKTIQNGAGIVAIACIVMFFFFVFSDMDFTIHSSKEYVSAPGGGQQIKYDYFEFSELLLYLFFLSLVILVVLIVLGYLIKVKDEDKPKDRY